MKDINYFEIQNYTFDDYMKLEKETIVKLLMNCHLLLYGEPLATSNNHIETQSSSLRDDKEEKPDKLHPCPYSTAVTCTLIDPCKGCETWAKFMAGEEIPRFQSSPQPQPGRGAEEIFYKFCNNLINDEYRIRDKKGFIKAIQEYRTQSEGKDMYPKFEINPRFWFMRDNHTFIPFGGKDINEIKQTAVQLAKENFYGMLCPVILTKGEEEIRRIGIPSHVDGKGYCNVDKWMDEILKDQFMSDYFNVPKS